MALAAAVLACLGLVACANNGESTGQPTTSSQPTTTISPEKIAKAEAIGDIAAGEELFYTPIDEVPNNLACSSCHSLDGIDSRSPSLAGISEKAGQRVEGLSDVEYLRQEIIDTAAFRERDWDAVMPPFYSDWLSEDQINDLIAFLLTQ